MAFAQQVIAGQAHFLAALVNAGKLRRPIRRRHALVKQLLRIDADHFAKSRVDVSDAPVQVAGAQTGQQRVFHGLAKGQRLAQIMLGLQPPAHVAAQQEQHDQQSQRHGGDQRRQHIGKNCRAAEPAFHSDDQRGSRQIQQLLGHENTASAQWRALQRQTRAIGLGERQGNAA